MAKAGANTVINRIQNHTRGYTLQELLIVACIVAVLFSRMVQIYSAQLEKAREAADLADVRAVYAEILYASMLGEERSYQDIRIRPELDGSIEAVIQPLTQKRDAWTLDARELSVGGINAGSDQWVGIPRGGGSCTLRYLPRKHRLTIDWGGNDLSTSAGRRREDIDHFHAIAGALRDAVQDETLELTGAYAEVAVFEDGAMAYFQEGGNSSRVLRAAVDHAGLDSANTPIYSTDAAWRHGCLIHYDRYGRVSYKAITREENQGHVIYPAWQGKPDLSDPDLIGAEWEENSE